MADRRPTAHPNESWRRVGQATVWALVYLCTWAAVAGLLPAPRYVDAERLRDEGVTAVTADVGRRVETGRGGPYVAEVEVTFEVDGRPVTTHLRHVQDVEAEDVIVRPERTGWGDGPREWQEDAAEIPPSSRYAAPVTVRYLADDPEVVMAQADLDALASEARRTPLAALFLVPLVLAAVVPGLRRLALRRGPKPTRDGQG